MAQMNANRADNHFQKFIKEVRDIRTIEQNIVTVDMAVFGNMGG
jgi:acyl-homoserine lactone acylase PvdQ